MSLEPTITRCTAEALVADGAGWHIADTEQVPDNVTLVTLPPYAPELKPAEDGWLSLP